MLDDLKVPPFNTTLMGVVRGVADYFGYEHSDAMLYGGTSHAFVINIHEVLCPSGPYCWNPTRFGAGLRNLGIRRSDLGFFHGGSPAAERQAIEATLKEHLDAGTPCALLNMENQLLTGYDDTGFLTTQPWKPHVDFPPAHLTWGTWAELGEEIHLSFFAFERMPPADSRTVVAESFATAVDMARHPEGHTDEPYGIGPRAYEKWIAAVEAGHGSAHGNWWNGTVWAECRAQAGDYLREIGQTWPAVAETSGRLAAEFGTIASHLRCASDKELGDGEKIEVLRQAEAAEAATVGQLEDLAGQLRQQSADAARG